MLEINQNNNNYKRNINIKSNLIYKKILEYCWEQDDLKKVFYWIKHTKLEVSSLTNLIKETQIREATRWKLSLMRVSFQFLTIILSTFEFNLSNSKFQELQLEKKSQLSLHSGKELDKIVSSTTTTSISTSTLETTNSIKTFIQLFKKQKFYSFEEDMIFQMHSFDNTKTIELNVNQLLKHYNKEKEIKEQLLKENQIKSNVKTLIFDFFGSIYVNPFMVYPVRLFYDCGLYESVKSIYAINQPHLTFLPYYFKDCKGLEIMSLHSDFPNSFGRPTNNVSTFSNNLNEMSLSIDDDNILEAIVPSIRYYFSSKDNQPPKHFTFNIILQDDDMCDDILNAFNFGNDNNNSILESLSISIDKLNLKIL
ncbi:hypothetical protein ACTA71_012105 [Dictyostelium dimigraforme]